MTNPERLPKKKVCDDDIRGNHNCHADMTSRSPHMPLQGSFELKLTGPAVWLLACGVAALLYALAQSLGG